MAYTFSVNNSPLTGPIAIYTLINTLISAGWLKKMDSDGTNYSSTGVQVTSGATGANGLNNIRAWIRLQAPAVNGQTRELTFQRGANSVSWRIKYSAAAGFTGGSPAATVTSSSTDEVFMIGGGSDASPTFLSWFSPDNTYRWHIAAGGASESYSFVAWSLEYGMISTMMVAIALDVMTVGSYPSQDIDPAVMYVSSDYTAATTILELISSNLLAANVTNSARARAWLGATSAAGASIVSNSVNVKILCYGNSVIGNSGTLGSNPWTNKDDLLPCLYASKIANGPVGTKGFSTLFLIGSINRGNMTVIDFAGNNTRDKVYVNGLWLPWSGAPALI